ncbi:Galactose oxidase/kelch, beta-propeller [Niveomyces insectorum RCEF 264]|uniref:Galactose oxidase/kelch, beta-propeller n=1 Tax=Niveomyces insectorum RCEF 264 TaxID=1081102 RepID=A0A167PUC3_9HYPO|nr:Galactose oxidase/kelch, beta-propeller [Niveomyces insectorum RCEF 264]
MQYAETTGTSTTCTGRSSVPFRRQPAVGRANPPPGTGLESEQRRGRRAMADPMPKHPRGSRLARRHSAGTRRRSSVTRRASITAVVAALLRLLPTAMAATEPPAVYPYTPTTILVPPGDNSGVVYIFAPGDDGRVDLLSVDVSATLPYSFSTNLNTLTQGVPFLPNGGRDNTASTFAPTLLSDGSIFVYAGGDCSTSNATAVVTAWSYVPSHGSQPSSASTAQWTSSDVTAADSALGPWFLGGGMAFSSQVAPKTSNATVYVYGGMCPSRVPSAPSSPSTSSHPLASPTSTTAITAANWQARALYSNKMTKLAPSGNTYTPSVVASKGPPIAEAGFTFTPLLPSLTNHSGVVSQQVNGVLLGGHTQTAFINMSTAAIWSLPQEAWSFVSIASPSSPASTTTSAAATVGAPPDSRSGHTAVLNEDGTALVVLGGWVGDVSQAANPQLAILNLGAGYDEWQWVIPTSQPEGAGRYGHGAALLPGNVMMVYGGYNISTSGTTSTSGSGPSSSTELHKRQSSSPSISGQGLQFFNITSLSWSDEYTNPTYVTSTGDSGNSSNDANSRKLGLGIGLGLGLPLALVLLVYLVRSCRRNSRHRRQRNEAVRALAQDHNQFLHDHDEMIESGGNAAFPVHWRPQDVRNFYTGGLDPYKVGARSLKGFESLRETKSSPAFPSVRSPDVIGGGVDGGDAGNSLNTMFNAGLRKPPRNVARGLYQPTTINDYENFLATSGAAGSSNTVGIHPIYEADEEEEDGNLNDPARQTVAAAGTVQSSGRSISPETEDVASLNDPFLTPSTMSVVAGPSHPVHTDVRGPNTLNLNPFVRNTPSPEVAVSRPRQLHIGGADADAGAGAAELEASAGGNAPAAAGQDRDVQEWVAGLDIEDILFAPPVPGAAAIVAASVSPAPGQMSPAGVAASAAAAAAFAARQPQGRASPTSLSRRLSLRSKTSSGNSPTRSSFLGAGSVAGAAATGGGVSDDEVRTGSNLSDRSAFTFLSRSTSSRSRFGRGNGGVVGGNNGSQPSVGPKVASNLAVSDHSIASYNTAQSSFRALRAEGPALLHGKGHDSDSSAGGSIGGASDFAAGAAGGVSDVRGGAVSPTGYSLRVPPPPLYAHEVRPSPAGGGGHIPTYEPYRGAAGVLSSGLESAGGVVAAASSAYMPWNQRSSYNMDEDNENTAPAGSPSKHKERRNWTSFFSRMFSSGSSANPPVDYNTLSSNDASPFDSSMGTGAQQELDDRNMAHATLLRRKQGRRDWEGDEVRNEENSAVGTLKGNRRQVVSIGSIHGTAPGAGKPAVAGVAAGGSVAAGRRDGSGKSDEWDVEKAVQSRNVQVMFTVHKEELRVVNAEVERDDDEADLGNIMPAHKVSNDDLDKVDDECGKSDYGKASAETPDGLSAPPPLSAPRRPQVTTPPNATLTETQKEVAKSKRLLASDWRESWHTDTDEDDDEDDNDDNNSKEIHTDEAQAVAINKGKMVDVGGLGAGDGRLPPSTRDLTVAAGFARMLLNREAERANVQTKALPMPAAVQTPEKPAAHLLTPTKALSISSVSTQSTSPLRRTGRRGTLGGDTPRDTSPAAAAVASVMQKPPGYVLGMVEKIETGSPPKSIKST